MAYDEKEQKQALARAKKFAKANEFLIDNGLRSLLSSREGRAFIWWLLQQGRAQDQPFRADPYLTAFACGELNVGQKILARVTSVDPGAYVKMQQEQLNEHDSFVGQPSADPEPSTEPEPGADDAAFSLEPDFMVPISAGHDEVGK
jgi:hypothetical protein